MHNVAGSQQGGGNEEPAEAEAGSVEAEGGRQRQGTIAGRVTVGRLCEAAGMSRQNYYKQRQQREEAEIDEALILSLVRKLRASHPRMGVRKLLNEMRPDLEEAGISLGRDRLYALLRRHNLLIPRRSRSCRTTDSRHAYRTHPNLLKDEEIERPGQAVACDLTYIRTSQGWMYLALVMDLYSRAILGYDCSDSLEAEGALRALRMAMANLPSGGRGTIHHSDRGIQYCCGAYSEELARAGFRVSMTEVNHCYENARAERLNGILKQEYGLGETLDSKATARAMVQEAVALYNTARPHASLAYRKPLSVYRQAA